MLKNPFRLGKIKKTLWLFLISLLISCTQKPASEYTEVSSKRGIALDGYDLIAYYDIEDNEPAVKGVDNFRVNHAGVDWYFSNAVNANEFVGAPDEYLPIYNGYAADQLSVSGAVIDGNPRIWAFFNNDLYLFRTRSGLRRWQRGDWKSFKAIADENYKLFTDSKKN